MKKYSTILILTSILVSACASNSAVDPAWGETRPNVSSFEAWDKDSNAWLTPQAFWTAHEIRRGAKNWPSAESYPPYAQVKEFDTFLAQTKTGTCLMEFYHQRWRRARDVWRWGEEFNSFSGCDTAFDQ